jgi:O-succinylbenzoic acid--CoA ligase
MLSQILDLRGDRPSPEELRLVLLGGGPASRDLLARARRLGYPVAPTYGLTEAASQVATRPPDVAIEDGADLSGGLRPLPGTQIRIASSGEEGAGAGEGGAVGEIEVRGPTVMQGYLDDPESTERVLHDGWLATGDLGRLDPDGGLRVLDRRSDLIVSGGENIYPAEIESVLLEHPDVAEAGVVGFADDAYGERPHGFLVAARGEPLDLDGVLDFCRERLARYKIPIGLVVVDALPRTASGKLLRRELKAHGESNPRTSSP